MILDYKKIYDIYLKDVSKYSNLTEKEAKELVIRKNYGDSNARERLINSNLRLVIEIAEIFSKDYDGLLYEELLTYIQVGTIGLIRAIDSYTIDCKSKLSDYVVPRIIGAINDYICLDKSITVSLRASHIYQKIQSLIEEYKSKGISLELKDLAKKLRIPQRSLCSLLFSPGIEPIFISATEEGNDIYDTVGLGSNTFEYDVEDKIASMYLDEYLKSNLTEEEIQIIKFLNGYYGKKYTYERVARIVGSTRNKIVSEEKIILRKLRAQKANNRQYLENAKEILLEK